jgi:UDP-N-acetylmuramoyl-tripeptide--D-alanyl-D-alanine ligase
LGLGGLTPDHQIAVLELSSGRAGKFEDTLAVASPHVLVLTNALASPVDTVGGLGRAVEELRQALAALPANGGLVLNYDDDEVRQLGLNAAENTVAYGLDISGPAFGADLLAYNTRLYPDRVTFDLRHETERLSECWIPLLGHPQLYAALAALGVGVLFQLSLGEGLNALSSVRSLPGRLSLLPGANQSLLIDDSFDASPVSLVAALDLLKALDDGQRRRILVLGDMDLPGDAADAEIAHRHVGSRVSQVCDLVVTRGRLAAVAGRAAMRMGMSSQQTHMVYSHSDAARIVRESLMPGDVALVTGSRQAAMERVSEQLLADPRADSARLPRRTPGWMDVLNSGTEVTSWVEVDLDAAANNVRQLKAWVGPDVTLAAVVKANAYGHGAVEIASTAICNGADVLCVDNLAEAVRRIVRGQPRGGRGLAGGRT